jgi:urease accessory protein
MLAAQMLLRPSGWQAELSLRFAPGGRARTELAGLRHRGPLRVQRAFYPQADGTCHVYVLHPPGGLVGGDTLTLDVEVATGARALVTTPAAGKFYRSERRWAVQTQRLRVAAGASLEWLPQENIFYSGTWARVHTHVELDAGACFLGWEVTVLGRPAAQESFAQGSCVQGLELHRGGRPLFLERGRYQGGDEILHAAWGLRGRTAVGLLVAVAPDARAVAALVPALREVVDAATFIDDDVLVCRALADDAQDVRARFAAAWTMLRPALLGSPAVAPRVWAT